MAGITFRRFRLIYRRSSTLMKCVVLATIIICIVTLTAISIKSSQEARDAEKLEKQAAALKLENMTLEERIALLGSMESTIRIAMEELGLYLPDTVIFEPVDSTDPE